MEGADAETRAAQPSAKTEESVAHPMDQPVLNNEHPLAVDVPNEGEAVGMAYVPVNHPHYDPAFINTPAMVVQPGIDPNHAAVDHNTKPTNKKSSMMTPKLLMILIAVVIALVIIGAVVITVVFTRRRSRSPSESRSSIQTPSSRPSVRHSPSYSPTRSPSYHSWNIPNTPNTPSPSASPQSTSNTPSPNVVVPSPPSDSGINRNNGNVRDYVIHSNDHPHQNGNSQTNNNNPQRRTESRVSAGNTIYQGLSAIQSRSWNTRIMVLNRGDLQRDPGHIFQKYPQKPLLIDSVNFEGENGWDWTGLTSDMLSTSLEWYPNQDSPIQENNGVIGKEKDEKQIRDLTRLTLMCLARETHDYISPAGRLPYVCPITDPIFSPYNIWLAMVDEDPNTDEYDGWKQKTIGKNVFHGRAGLEQYPAQDDKVENYFREVLMMDEEDEIPKTVREMVRLLTSDAPRIIREVLQEYGMLTVVRQAYRNGTLMQYLNELWKPEWTKNSGERLKTRVRELVGPYSPQSFRAFSDWVQRQSDDGPALKALWSHWTGLSVLTERKLQSANLRTVIGSYNANDGNHFITGHTCIAVLDIPSTLNDRNIENVMRVSLQSSGYGTA